MEEIRIQSEQETEQFGEALAAHLTQGSVVALSGDLGAGKTTLTKAIAKGLGIRSLITSPSFPIVHEYRDGRLPLYHFDVYRVADLEEMDELGYEEYFYGDGVSVVEWADKFPALFPDHTIWIDIAYGDSEYERIYRIESETEHFSD